MYNISIKKSFPYIIIFFVAVVAYLPLSTFYFGMKNDAFSDNFPNKFFLSEALHAGMNPLWNPYMNFGFPIYADMGFAFWNPITWFFALIGYNAYTLTAEVLLYIFIAGISMFLFGKYLRLSLHACTAIAAMYMCSGFFSGSIQYINFITSAAFLPAAFMCLHRIIHMPSLRNAVWLSLSAYMVLAGGHPAIPIGFCYAALVFVFIILIKNPVLLKNKVLVINFLIAVLLLLLLFSPAIYSYVNILPSYGRNQPAEQELFIEDGSSWSSLVSFIYPFFTAVSHDYFTADVAFRNFYIGIGGLLLAGVVFSVRNAHKSEFLIPAFAGLLLSVGGWVKYYLFTYLPGLNFVRNNGEYRIFTILFFVILAGFGFDMVSSNRQKSKLFFLKVNTFMFVLSSLTVIVICLFFCNSLKEEINAVFISSGFTNKVKTFLSSSGSLFLFISVCITIILALAYKRLSWRNSNLLLIIILIDLSINSIIYLPVTGIGQKRVADIQAIYDRTKPGIPIPDLIPVNELDTLDEVTTGLTGEWSYYSKEIGVRRLTDYPSFFSGTSVFFKDSVSKPVLHKPFLFLKSNLNDTSANEKVRVHIFRPDFVTLSIWTPKDDTLVFLQNNYKFWNASVNQTNTQISTAYHCFMSVPVKKGDNLVSFRYQDTVLFYFMFFSVTLLIVTFFVLLRSFLLYRNETK